MTDSVHLIRVGVDPKKIYRFAPKARGEAIDDGYAVHALFAGLFDHGVAKEERVSPKPFRVLEPSHGRLLEVLAYSRLEGAALIERAQAFSDPRAWDACEVSAIASRPMPRFEVGARLGFSVRVCPVRRVAKRGNQKKERAEVDVFLAKAWEINDDAIQLDRETVYREWLQEEFAKGGSNLVSASMKTFKRGRQERRTQGDKRTSYSVCHPEVTFEGVCEVRDANAFAERLKRGLGRHRAFGFGMLLLKPARES